MPHDSLIPAPDERYILLAADCIRRAAATQNAHEQIERLLSAIGKVERAKISYRKTVSREVAARKVKHA